MDRIIKKKYSDVDIIKSEFTKEMLERNYSTEVINDWLEHVE